MKLLAVELHTGEVSSSKHREACQTILSHLFGQGITEIGGGQTMSPFLLEDASENASIRTVGKSKVIVVIEFSWFFFYYGLSYHMHVLEFMLFTVY